ncbi:MAG: HAD-IC family P-type ATPase [bacterium]
MTILDKNLIKEPFWAISANDSIALLRSSHLGITESDVIKRKKIFGENKIISKKRFVKLKILLNQFKSPLIYILVIAGIITLFLGDLNDAIFIFIAVIINTALGFYQENKAEKALSSLANYLEKKTRVIRNGQIKEITIEELVPGDIINFSSGDNIPADGRIIHSNNLIIDEAILTGESLPEEKSSGVVELKAVLGDRKSMVFSGTLVVEGVGSAVVVSTGGNTELGAIATLITSIKDEFTPLQKTINSFANKLTIVILLLSSMIFALGLIYKYSFLEMFTMSIAIAVAAVPEGLTIAITVILAVGVERLAKRKGVVKRLLSAETLGDTSIILTDKTGTLTEAKMNLVRVEAPFVENQTNLLDYQKMILKSAILCTDAHIENPNAPISEWEVIGKALDSALIRGAGKDFGLNEFELRKNISILDRLPFNSQNKFSAVKIKDGENEVTLIIGAPEVVLKISHSFYWNDKRDISEKEKTDILQGVHKNALEGYRIISVALSERDMNLKDINKIDGFSYLGNILLKDPIRKDVGQVIKAIENDGIKTVIITGDHTGTAISVAREIGMIVDKKSVIEQHELDLMDDEELLSRLSEVKIFSRINPQSKVRITKIFQNAGYIVAMTGDGVNDAPALKQADVGIATGSGSEVARESSDLVLLDDSFHTIVSAIDEGRRILQNIRKVLVFCLLSLFDEILLVGGAIVLNIPLPFTALQILWVNFIADSFPAISLSYEDEKTKEMVIRKKISRKSIFDNEVKFLIWGVGILTSVFLFTLHYFLLRFGFNENLVKTFVFASFGIYTLLLIFSVRSLDKNIWEYNPFSNKFTNFSSVIGIFLMFLAIYNPILQKLLDTTSLPLIWILAVFLVGFFCFAMMEIGKFIFIKKNKMI